MYPFSLTDCSVGRFIRNFISLVRTFLGSLSPTELDEWTTLGLEAGGGDDVVTVVTMAMTVMMTSDLRRRLSPPLPNLSPGAAPSWAPTFSYSSPSSSSERCSWYSWGAATTLNSFIPTNSQHPMTTKLSRDVSSTTAGHQSSRSHRPEGSGRADALTSCRMVSVRTLYQSLMMLSVSYWTRKSTPLLLFNWRREEFSQRPPEVSVRCLWSPPTSNTFFLLDFSLEAQPNVAPRRSTVNSGTI